MSAPLPIVRVYAFTGVKHKTELIEAPGYIVMVQQGQWIEDAGEFGARITLSTGVKIETMWYFSTLPDRPTPWREFYPPNFKVEAIRREIELLEEIAGTLGDIKREGLP